MATTTRHRLLDRSQILAKIQRIAFQIYEHNYAENHLVLVGVVGNGVPLARMLAEELVSISSIRPQVATLDLDKQAPLQGQVHLDLDTETLRDKCVVVVDDVLNTGRTLAYGMRPFWQVPLRRVQVAVLVNRDHQSFPVAADFVGYALATTLQAHVEVCLADDDYGVYLR